MTKYGHKALAHPGRAHTVADPERQSLCHAWYSFATTGNAIGCFRKSLAYPSWPSTAGSHWLSACHTWPLCLQMADQCEPLWFKTTPTMPPQLEKCCHEEGSKGPPSIRHIGGAIVSKAMVSTECEYHPPPDTCQERLSPVSASTMLQAMFKSASENCGPPKKLFSAWRPHTGAAPCRSKYRSAHKDCSFGSSTASSTGSTFAAFCV